MAARKKAKSIKVNVTEVEDNSVRVRIEHSPKMTEVVDSLVELNNKSFHKIVKVARKYRRINKLASKLFDCEKVDIKVKGKDDAFEIINNLMSLGSTEYKMAVRCAKKYRRANKMLDLAIMNYKALADAENQKVGVAYA